jgi:hypothetical protein
MLQQQTQAFLHHPFQVGPSFRGFAGSLIRYEPVELLASLTDPTGYPSRRDVYSRASNVSVTLHVAEYDYGGIWAFSTDGTCTRWNSS